MIYIMILNEEDISRAIRYYLTNYMEIPTGGDLKYFQEHAIYKIEVEGGDQNEG